MILAITMMDNISRKRNNVVFADAGITSRILTPPVQVYAHAHNCTEVKCNVVYMVYIWCIYICRVYIESKCCLLPTMSVLFRDLYWPNIEARLGEHKADVRKGNVETSAVAEHIWSKGHQVDWQKCSVLMQESDLHRRCFLESWFIQRNVTMNREAGSLSSAYNALCDC